MLPAEPSWLGTATNPGAGPPPGAFPHPIPTPSQPQSFTPSLSLLRGSRGPKAPQEQDVTVPLPCGMGTRGGQKGSGPRDAAKPSVGDSSAEGGVLSQQD